MFAVHVGKMVISSFRPNWTPRSPITITNNDNKTSCCVVVSGILHV